MKKIILLLSSIIIFYGVKGGTLKLQPYGTQGSDCEIWTLSPNTNNSGYPRIEMNAWTWNGTPGVERTLMNFNWSLIPANATITSASLSLYGNVGSTEDDETLNGSNASYIQRITSPWTFSTVTWNTQPTTDAVDEVTLPQTTGQYDDYLNIDVTALVKDIVNNPNAYYGFMFLLQNENYYRRMVFKSADQPDSSRFPTLTINYIMNGSCLTLYPYGNQGTDGVVWSVQPNLNQNAYPRVAMNAWTWNGTPGIERSLMNFNWNLIPNGATNITATLSLYGNVGSTENSQSLSGSNASYIQRVTSAWSKSTVTWNTQPTTDTVHKVILPQTVGNYDDYLNIDVTELVKDHYNNPALYDGFLFLLQNENYYRRMDFKSTDQTDTSRFPKLVICYTLNGSNPPTTTFQSSGNTFCSEAGACVNFFDHSTGNPTSWQWSFPGALTTTSGQQNPTNICYTNPGTYSVTLITGNSNGYDTLTISPMITLGQPPPAPTVTLTGSDTLHSSHASYYQWYFNGSPVFGATDSFYVFSSIGIYSVRVTDSLGCSVLSGAYVYTSIGLIPGQNEVGVYPNPAKGQINFSKAVTSAELFDVCGRKVDLVLSGDNKAAALPDVSKGIYILHFLVKEKPYWQKLLIE